MSGNMIFFSPLSPSCDSSQTYDNNKAAIFLASATWAADHREAYEHKYGHDQSSEVKVWAVWQFWAMFGIPKRWYKDTDAGIGPKID